MIDMRTLCRKGWTRRELAFSRINGELPRSGLDFIVFFFLRSALSTTWPIQKGLKKNEIEENLLRKCFQKAFDLI